MKLEMEGEVNKLSEVVDIELTVQEQSRKEVLSLSQGQFQRTVYGSHCLDLIYDLSFTGK